MKAYICVDADSGPMHTVRGTSGDMNDVIEANSLLHRQECVVFADADYQGTSRRPAANADVNWCTALRPALDKDNEIDVLVERMQKFKASMRAKVEHPSRVIKRQLGNLKARYRRQKKNIAKLVTLFALSNLWMARRKLLAVQA